MVDVIVERCAGLDVHRDNVVATVRVPGSGRPSSACDRQTGRSGRRSAGLDAAVRVAGGVRGDLVGMEATGVYWKTVFQALEDRFECWLVNAHHLRNVPGRKTDVKDSRVDLPAGRSTGWCGRASCRRRRSAGCVT